MKRSAPSSPPHETAGAGTSKTSSANSPAKFPKLSKSSSPCHEPIKIENEVVEHEGIDMTDLNSPPGGKRDTWFEKLPESRAEFTSCTHFVTGSRGTAELFQFAKILIGHLKGLSYADDDMQGVFEGVSLELKSSSEHVNEIIQLLQLVIVHMFPLLKPVEKPIAHQLLAEIMEMYILGSVTFTGSRIPEILVQLSPAAAFQIVEFVRSTGDISLLIPICSDSTANFTIITKYFAQTPPAYSLAASLVTFLLSNKKQFIFPCWFRDVAIFEHTCQLTDTSTPNTEEFHKVLNEAVYRCIQAIEYADGDENHMQFMFLTQPQTSRLLIDEMWSEKIRRWDHPELWMFLKRRSAAQQEVQKPLGVNMPMDQDDQEITDEALPTPSPNYKNSDDQDGEELG